MAGFLDFDRVYVEKQESTLIYFPHLISVHQVFLMNYVQKKSSNGQNREEWLQRILPGVVVAKVATH